MAAKQEKVQEEAKTGRGMRKTREGIVVSDKMDKTVTVAITRLMKHPTYKKYIRKTTKYLAHDQKEECAVGDTVRIVETKPISKRKRWKVEEVIAKAV